MSTSSRLLGLACATELPPGHTLVCLSVVAAGERPRARLVSSDDLGRPAVLEIHDRPQMKEAA